MFTCICGKQFKTKQALNGHKGYCKEYLGKDKYLQVLKNNKDGQIKAKETLLKQSSIKKEQQLQQWISEKHKCEKCGKLMTEYYGSGRFCCKECARGFSNYKGIYDPITKENTTLKFKCEKCGKRYETEYGLKVHFDKHHLLPKEKRNVKVAGYEIFITNEQLDEYRLAHTKCEICGKDVEDIRKENNHFKKLCIDHNHVTNEFRGLLCMTCNSALGWFEKNEDAVLKYLNDRGKQNKNP